MSSKDVMTKVTKQYLKDKTKEFDVGCIYQLDLSSLGIFDLGCIGECTGLVILDLSNNKISSVNLLAPLKQLQVLNLANNRLASIDGIEKLDALSSLDLSANFIPSFDSLRPLLKLDKFVHLRLNGIGKSFSNPVSQNETECKKKIMDLLPGLQTLDGQILRGKGSEFFELCEELDSKLGEMNKRTMNRRDLAIKNEAFPNLAGDLNSKSNLDDSISHQQKLIEGLLKDCANANTRAANAAEAKTDLPLLG